MNLTTYTDRELDDLIREIQQEKDNRWWARVLAAAKQAKEIQEDYFQTVANAMFYQCSKSSTPSAQEAKELMPKDETVRDIAYHLAEIAYAKHQKLRDQNEETLAVYRKLKSFFDEGNFVFQHTHYEYCDNGHYYRMS